MSSLERMSDSEPQLIRLRLPSVPGYVYLLRHLGQEVDGYKGADQLETVDGKLLGATAPSLLLRRVGQSDRPQVRMLSLDLRRAGRGLARPSERWSAVVRRTLTGADDLIYDAAASLGDRVMADATSGDTAFHRTYQFLWGGDQAPIPAPERMRTWDRHVEWLGRQIAVLRKG